MRVCSTIARGLKISIVLACSVGGVLAHSGMSGPVGERMQDMLDLGKGLRSLTQEMRGENRTDQLFEAAQDLHEKAALISMKFEQNVTTDPSEALPQIWLDWENFDARAQTLADTAEQLMAAINNQDDAQTQALAQNIRAQCTQCHDVYRAP